MNMPKNFNVQPVLTFSLLYDIHIDLIIQLIRHGLAAAIIFGHGRYK